jgi:quercetin dioxygenase-like cupin family protein
MREKQNMDLTQLAHRVGFDPKYLEDVEAGRVSPAVGLLIQISRALSVDSATLLAEEKKEERRQSYRKRTRAYSYQSLTPDAEDKHLWAYLITLDPKKEHEMVSYQHEGEEFVYVLEGRIELQIENETHILKAGASLHFNSGLKHLLKNLSSKHSKLIVVVYTP